MALVKKGVRLFFNGSLVAVLERKQGLEKKTRFYLYDTVSKQYISGLYFISRVENSGSMSEVYAFDYKGFKYLLEYGSDGSYKIIEQK